jgi:hypothetical protein
METTYPSLDAGTAADLCVKHELDAVSAGKKQNHGTYEAAEAAARVAALGKDK